MSDITESLDRLFGKMDMAVKLATEAGEVITILREVAEKAKAYRAKSKLLCHELDELDGALEAWERWKFQKELTKP